ncbi:MAG: hypothetical protein ACXAB2_08830 [Candidatus Hodarchaeales archaeon]
MQELNTDQLKILSTLKSPSTYVTNAANGDKDIGLPYKAIMKATDLSLEKTLLSLGALEAKKLVEHTCAVQRQFVDYLGHSSVEITGQKVVRMFSLTPKGKEV